VATFKKANKYAAPSKKVVAGPKAANCCADDEEEDGSPPLCFGDDNPTKAVSTKLSSGCATHRPKQGTANRRNCATVGNEGTLRGKELDEEPPPRRLITLEEADGKVTGRFFFFFSFCNNGNDPVEDSCCEEIEVVADDSDDTSGVDADAVTTRKSKNN